MAQQQPRAARFCRFRQKQASYVIVYILLCSTFFDPDFFTTVTVSNTVKALNADKHCSSSGVQGECSSLITNDEIDTIEDRLYMCTAVLF